MMITEKKERFLTTAELLVPIEGLEILLTVGLLFIIYKRYIYTMVNI